MSKFQEAIDKLKHEWKTFTIAVLTTVVGAWQSAVAMGADLPSLLDWVPEKYKSVALFGLGLGLLLFRRYYPSEPEVK